MSKNDFSYNDYDEIVHNGKNGKKKKKFRDNGRKVRDFKRDFSQERDREDLNFNRRYR